MIKRLLVANRGEVALRVMRSAAEMGMQSLAVAPADDQACLHWRRADLARSLQGQGPAAYLDAAQIIRIAQENDCQAIHPGYGFLSENADFARASQEAGLIFIGPTPAQLQTLGDKVQARALAQRCAVPVLEGSSQAVTLAQARKFMRTLGQPVMVKALAGGGGRGIRPVNSLGDLDAAYARCQSEAQRAFGDGRVYAERALIQARHIEVQIVGDGKGGIAHLGERDCSLQRRRQKLVEIAPSPGLSPKLRKRLQAAALKMAAKLRFKSLGTFEFLVDREEGGAGFYFLEANPRLQVEHTVTEELWGLDLVRLQLLIAAGATLADLRLADRKPRAGYALQARINAERLLADGQPVMEGGTLLVFEPASGPGVRVDTHGYRGYVGNPAYDSLLAKLVVSTESEDFSALLAKAGRALAEFSVQGMPVNLSFLRALLEHPKVRANQFGTAFADEHLGELLAQADAIQAQSDSAAQAEFAGPAAAAMGDAGPAGPAQEIPEGLIAIRASFTASIVCLLVAPGDKLAAGQSVAVLEAMKMEHVVCAESSGSVKELLVAPGAMVKAGQALLTMAPDGRGDSQAQQAGDEPFDAIRPDLAEVLHRQQAVQDAQRPQAVARRHAKGARTARENVAALCDAGSFVEYGALAVAAQRARRSLEELAAKTPGDGVVVGFGMVNGAQFERARAQCLIVAFDETVLAGTMGEMARNKLRHALAVSEQARRPVILFAEGGGGRAGDTDGNVAITGWTLDVSCYYQLGRMSGLAPLVGVTSGRCFAANASMLACCDVIIATEGSNIGVGGPSMVEGGRLGQFTPEQIGPMEVQCANGVVDLLVAGEAQAAEAAKQYLSYFQGTLRQWQAPDDQLARQAVPANRLRAYDMRKTLAAIADCGSVLELRARFGLAMITALIRVEGRALGVIANNPLHLGGAIDSEAADKASRFMGLCEAFGLPILMLCDTPGVMVGPEAEKAATVRKMGRMFVTGANLTVPFFTIVLRKAYGIGAELMAGGWFKAPRFVVSWPTGEFGGMNIEGNVKLAHGAQLAAVADPKKRQALFEQLVAQMHASGRALSVATHCEIDNVIDPADSRAWISSAMASHPERAPMSGKTRPFVEPW